MQEYWNKRAVRGKKTRYEEEHGEKLKVGKSAGFAILDSDLINKQTGDSEFIIESSFYS